MEKEKVQNCLRICDCGLADFKRILEYQHQLCEERRLNQIPDTVLIVEHFPVITLGARKSANKLKIPKSDIVSNDIDVVDIRRGGGTTAHNQGQLVFYPVFNLQQLKLGISEYVRKLESVGIELLKEYGVSGQRLDKFPGVWVGAKKIASIGVRVSKFVTYHGMSINIDNDLSIFDFIIPCGLDNIEMTSVLKETGRKCDMEDVKLKLKKILADKFSNGGAVEYEKCA